MYNYSLFKIFLSAKQIFKDIPFNVTVSRILISTSLLKFCHSAESSGISDYAPLGLKKALE